MRLYQIKIHIGPWTLLNPILHSGFTGSLLCSADPGVHPWDHITLCCHMILASPWIIRVFQTSSLVFYDHDSFEECEEGILQVLHFGFTARVDLQFQEEGDGSGTSFSSHHLKGTCHPWLLIDEDSLTDLPEATLAWLFPLQGHHVPCTSHSPHSVVQTTVISGSLLCRHGGKCLDELHLLGRWPISTYFIWNHYACMLITAHYSTLLLLSLSFLLCYQFIHIW